MKRILLTSLLLMVWTIDAILYVPVKIFIAISDAIKEPQKIVDRPRAIVNPLWIEHTRRKNTHELAESLIADAEEQAKYIAGYREKTDGEKIRDIYKDKFLK